MESHLTDSNRRPPAYHSWWGGELSKADSANHACFRPSLIDPHLAEELGILPQRLEYSPPELVLEIDVACRSVVEPKPENKPRKRLDGARS